jgi:double zinc ribbon protein/uncharacterized protein DUF4339
MLLIHILNTNYKWSIIMKLIQCIKCKAEIDDICKFCPHCGEKFQKEIECSSCRFINDCNSKFCINCGSELHFKVKEINDISIDLLKQDKSYFYHSNNEQHGGFSYDEFKTLVKTGKIDKNTLISIDGAQTWQWSINVSIFKRILEDSPAPKSISSDLNTTADTRDLKVWYLTKNGERVGPLSELEMKTVIDNGIIRFGNKVFKEGDVEWILLENSELGKYLHTSPPLIGKDFRNNTAWWIAFAPVISFILQFLLIYISYNNRAYDATVLFINWGFLIYFVINLILVARDANNLENSGHDTSQFGNIIFIPIYLWKRNKILAQTQATFWFWFLFTFIDFFLSTLINVFAIL